MDYNIRAARAGFAGIWVGGAYVARPARSTSARPSAAANRRLYQDRFCGLRFAARRGLRAALPG